MSKEREHGSVEHRTKGKPVFRPEWDGRVFATQTPDHEDVPGLKRRRGGSIGLDRLFKGEVRKSFHAEPDDPHILVLK